MPKFSVTIPAYKAAYLAECIESVLRQTFDDFELIIVNDCSPEDLDSIVKQFDDPRIFYYKNAKNCGAIKVVDNWNICLSYATGRYLICMGDDDCLKPICLAEYDRMIEKFPNLGLYHAMTEIINENSEVIDVQHTHPQWESVYSMMWHQWNGRRCEYIGDFLFDVNRLRADGGFYFLPLAWDSDEISAFRAASVGGVANSQIPIFQYRKSSLTLSSSSNLDIKMKAYKLAFKWYDDFLSIKPAGDELTLLHYSLLVRDLYIRKQKAYEHNMINAFKTTSLFQFIKYMYSLHEEYDLSYKIIVLSYLKGRFGR